MNKIKLRSMDLDDKDGVFDLLQNSKVMKHIGPKRALSYDESADWFEEELRLPSRFVVALDKTNEIIGFCGIKEIDGRLDFGYFLREKFWGKGLATEACKMALSKLTRTTDLSKVEIFIANNNYASKKIARKLKWSILNELEKDGELGCIYAANM